MIDELDDISKQTQIDSEEVPLSDGAMEPFGIRIASLTQPGTMNPAYRPTYILAWVEPGCERTRINMEGVRRVLG